MTTKRLFHKDFTLVVIGQIISLFGNGIVRFALPLYLLNQTGSASLFGFVAALSFLPMIVLTPIGGIIADRVNKRNVMVTLDFITAALMLLFFFLLGKVDLTTLSIVTLMLLNAIQGAYQPTVQASMPILHTKENLLPANAVINQVSALSGLLSPIIGGLLFGLWGLLPIIVVGGFCFLFSALMEIFICIPHNTSMQKQSIIKIVRGDFADSYHFLKRDKPIILQSIFIICGINLFLGAMMFVLMPVVITQTLNMTDQLYGYSQGAFAAGGLFGGISVSIFAKKLHIKYVYLLLFITAVLLFPIFLCLWLNSPPFASYLVITTCSFLLMSVATMVTILMLTFIQGEIPKQLTGKVLSLTMALAMCVQPIGQALYGLLFDVFKTTPHFIVLGAAIISGAIAFLSKGVFSSFHLVNSES